MHDSKDTPCHHCKDRWVDLEKGINCHSDCKKWDTWKEEHDAKLADYNKKSGFAKDLIGYDLQTNNALKKRARWGKRGRH